MSRRRKEYLELDRYIKRELGSYLYNAICDMEEVGLRISEVVNAIRDFGHASGIVFDWKDYYPKFRDFIEDLIGDKVVITGQPGREILIDSEYHAEKAYRTPAAETRASNSYNRTVNIVPIPNKEDTSTISKAHITQLEKENAFLKQKCEVLEKQLSSTEKVLSTLLKTVQDSQLEITTCRNKLQETEKAVNGRIASNNNVTPASSSSQTHNVVDTTKNSEPIRSLQTYLPAPSGLGPKLKFIHNFPDHFCVVITELSKKYSIPDYILERDYYVSHMTWCLQQLGFVIHVKGGVSLSKGFRLISRISEDVDVVLGSGQKTPKDISRLLTQLAEYRDSYAVPKRCKLLKRLAQFINNQIHDISPYVAGGKSAFFDPYWQQMALICPYSSMFLSANAMDQNLVPAHVVFEIAAYDQLQIVPFVPRPFTSHVHEFLGHELRKQKFIIDNTPGEVLCVHPAVTLLQKISDGIVHRFPRAISEQNIPHYATGLRGNSPPFDPRIVRHYEDVASVIAHLTIPKVSTSPLDPYFPTLPPKYKTLAMLYIDMIDNNLVRRKPADGHIIHDSEALSFKQGTDSENGYKFFLLQECQKSRRPLHYKQPVGVKDCTTSIKDFLLDKGM